MNKSTIFGEESFFDNYMVEIYEAKDNYVYDKVSGAIKVAMPNVQISEERLKKWVNLCLKLDNIDKSDLIDMATQKKFFDLQHRLDVAEKALELACNEELRSFGEYDEDYGYEKQFQMLKEQYIEEAEREVKGVVMEEKERYDMLISKKNYIEIFDNINDRWITEDNICDVLNDYHKKVEELREENQQLKEENRYIIFVDGYDENGNEVHKQEFIKYKDKFKELVEENKQLKQSIKEERENLQQVYSHL